MPRTQPTKRMSRGFVLLVMVFLAAVLGYRWIFRLDWMHAVWLTVVSITGVGFSEESTQSHAFQLFTVIVILFGFVSAAYALSGFIQLLLAGEFERLRGKRRMEKEIGKLRDHVVICGYGRLGQCLAADLASYERSLVVIDNDDKQVEAAQDDRHLVIAGDATEEEILKAAGLTWAKSLVTSLPSDAANVFITLTARNLNPDVQIIARAEQPSTESKLQQAGASKIVMPTTTSARHMVRMLTQPSTARLIDLLAERSYFDIEMDELVIPPSNRLVGVSVRESQVNYKHRLLVVAVKQADDSMVFNPGGDYEFLSDDVAIVMGKRGDIDAFCKLHNLHA